MNQIKSFIIQHAISLMVSAGGVGLIFTYGQTIVLKAIDIGLAWALNNKSISPVLIKYRPQIEALFDAIDADIKAKLDAAKNP